LLVNYPQWCDRAEIIWQGEPTAASSCGAGRQVQLDIGSSYLPSEINAAFLWAQLESAAAITQKRIDIWQQYHQAFAH